MTTVFQELARWGQVTTGSGLSEPYPTTAPSSEVASTPRDDLWSPFLSQPRPISPACVHSCMWRSEVTLGCPSGVSQVWNSSIRLGWPVSTRDLLFLASQMWGDRCCCMIPEVELRSPCLEGKLFTNRAICQALYTFLKPFPGYLCCPEEAIAPSLGSEMKEEASKWWPGKVLGPLPLRWGFTLIRQESCETVDRPEEGFVGQ